MIISDATLKFINDMLMEDDDEQNENKPYTFHDFSALQATEQSFYEALHNNPEESSKETEYIQQEEKHLLRKEEELRSNKRFAGNVPDETVSFEMYDNVLLYSDTNHHQKENRDKKVAAVTNTNNTVDLRGLMMTCSQAMAGLDTSNVLHLLMKIRAHSSPRGGSLERVDHYFANALEARLAGTGSEMYAALKNMAISPAQILRAHKVYITAFPFYKMSTLLANKAIEKSATGAKALHIVDFGIQYGFQWPALIKTLSERQGGPPKLRIAGIDSPAERLEETGRRLSMYCERFGVPFEYDSIDKEWETIGVEDVKIGKDEVVVVNSLNRLHYLLDETTTNVVGDGSSPRDDVLNLIKKIEPEVFVHGIANGQHSSPFFTVRFSEAFFHLNSMFDMLEATVLPGEDESRMLLEERLFGAEAMNVVACEWKERVERPETYKQWQVRMGKAGFRQLPLDRETVGRVTSKVEAEYHKEFSVGVDGKWMLQGWKGRVVDAVSCWQLAARC